MEEELYKISLRGDVESLTEWRTRNPQPEHLRLKFTSYLRSPLHIAAMCGHIEFAEKLLSIDSHLIREIDSCGFSPLHLASARQSLSMVNTLLTYANEDAGADAYIVRDQDGRSPLHLAAMKNRVDIINVLYANRSDAIHIRVNDNNETILHLCVKHNSLGALKSLIFHLQSVQPVNPVGITVNSVNSDGNTILHLAAAEEKFECFRYLVETKDIRIETNAVNNDNKKARDLLPPIERDALEIGFYNTKKGPKVSTNWLIERVNALMVVATLIAGITFQAAMNPPGGVFQEDFKINATDDPVTFAYYLGTMVGTDMSSGFKSYLDHHSKLPSFVNNISAPRNITQPKNPRKVKNFRKVTSAQFTNEILQKIYKMSPRHRNLYSQGISPGIVLGHDRWNTVISKYDRDPSFFPPYLLFYAGTPILAYRYPEIYNIYMVSNAIAFIVSLCMIFLVISGFISKVFITQQVRVLVGMMIVAILCWLVGYLTVFVTMSPPFYVNQTLFIGALGASYIIMWLGVGLGTWFYQKIIKRLKYWMQNISWKYMGRKEILVDQFQKEDSPSFIHMPGVVTRITMVLLTIMIIGHAVPCITCNNYDGKK